MNKNTSSKLNYAITWYWAWAIITSLGAIGITILFWLNQNAASFKVPDGIN